MRGSGEQHPALGHGITQRSARRGVHSQATNHVTADGIGPHRLVSGGGIGRISGGKNHQPTLPGLVRSVSIGRLVTRE